MEAKDVPAGRLVEPGRDHQRQHPSSPLDGHVDRGALRGIEAVRKVLELHDRATIDRANHIAATQARIGRRRACIHRTDLDGRFNLRHANRHEDGGEDEDRQDQVEGGPSHDDEKSLPERMSIEAAWAGIHAAVHAGKLDEPAQGNAAYGVQRFSSLDPKQLGAKTDAELFDLDAREFGGEEMARFVHDDQQAEDHDDERDEDHRAHASSSLRRRPDATAARTRARACRSAAKRVSRDSSSTTGAVSSACSTSGTMSMNRHWPSRKTPTAASFAALRTAGAVPPRSPAALARLTAGYLAWSSGSKLSRPSAARSGAGLIPSILSGKPSAIAIGRCMSGSASCALTLPSTNSTIEWTTLSGWMTTSMLG